MLTEVERVVLATGVLLLGGQSLLAQARAVINPDCEKLLPATLVAKASGRAKIQLIAPDPAVGAGGDCNYGIDTKTMVLLVNLNRFARPQDFQRYKTEEMFRTNQKPIPGLGDEAFTVDGVAPGSVVVARKGKTLVILSSFVDIDPQTGARKGPYVSRAQLIELARQMLAKS